MTQMVVHCLLRKMPWYRYEAFESGLRAVGADVVASQPARLNANTIVLMWNRYAQLHELACRVEAAGGMVLVAENGYIGEGGVSPKFDVHPHGPKASSYYALSIGYHNGGGRYFQGAERRWPRLGIEVKPWRQDGEYVLVCPNRSFGPPERTMRADWADATALWLSRHSKYPVRVRRHPGNVAPKHPLSADLAGARAVYIWSSTVGVHALVEGIPVFVAGPQWIMKGAACGGTVNEPSPPEREPHLESMAWQQWTVSEIEQGIPFRNLLPR